MALLTPLMLQEQALAQVPTFEFNQKVTVAKATLSTRKAYLTKIWLN